MIFLPEPFTQQHSDFMSPEKLQMFVAGLSGLAPEEVRKAKVLYLKNAISEYRAAKSSLAAFQQVQGCFSIVPFFWPILAAQKRTMNAGFKLMRDRIENAIEVWKDDLGGATFSIDEEPIE